MKNVTHFFLKIALLMLLLLSFSPQYPLSLSHVHILAFSCNPDGLFQDGLNLARFAVSTWPEETSILFSVPYQERVGRLLCSFCSQTPALPRLQDRSPQVSEDTSSHS